MQKALFSQLLPILCAVLAFFVLSIGIREIIALLNLLPTTSKIIPHLRLPDVLIGLTVYLKTSIDFALFIGILMSTYPGIKNRIAIELGTALGNGLGTMLVLCLWVIFKEIPILLFCMILLAALVLLRMAEESLEQFITSHSPALPKTQALLVLLRALQTISRIVGPITSRILPSSSLSRKKTKTHTQLFIFSLTIPFILGLDDFAGYIPLFSLVNVFGFAVGAFFGHMLLSAALFVAPAYTTSVVRHPAVMLLGSFAFIIIAGIGFVEAGKIAALYFFPR